MLSVNCKIKLHSLLFNLFSTHFLIFFVFLFLQEEEEEIKLEINVLKKVIYYKAMSSNRTTIQNKEQGSYCFTM